MPLQAVVAVLLSCGSECLRVLGQLSNARSHQRCDTVRMHTTGDAPPDNHTKAAAAMTAAKSSVQQQQQEQKQQKQSVEQQLQQQDAPAAAAVVFRVAKLGRRGKAAVPVAWAQRGVYEFISTLLNPWMYRPILRRKLA
jgi:hypothetical protein